MRRCRGQTSKARMGGNAVKRGQEGWLITVQRHQPWAGSLGGILGEVVNECSKCMRRSERNKQGI